MLWTGGWDSTYRILDLVLNKKEKVQPYYVLDYSRKSTQVEIKTMNKIKTMISEKNPDTINLINDTIYINREDIVKNERISGYYRKLLSTSHLASQTEWIARYIVSKGIDNLDLGIHKDDNATKFIKNDVELIEVENDSFYRLVKNPSKEELYLFSYFNFPLLDLTKLEMAKRAIDKGFSHIMNETWFCYNPLKDGKPCGVCNPCKHTRIEGLGRRIPKVTLYRRYQVFVLKVKHRLKKNYSNKRF